MSAPPAKKSKQNDGKANPQQSKPQQQQQGKKQQPQQGGKPQPPKQQQQQGKKDKQPKQPQQPPQQAGQDGPKLSKNQKKKQKKQQQQGGAGAAPTPASTPAPTKLTKQDKKHPEKKQDSKKRPLEQKEEPEENEQDEEEEEDEDGFEISDECLEQMADIQGKLDRVERKGAKEIAEIEKKMALERQSIYIERAKQLRTIPHVWREIFTTVDVFANELQENDVEILQYLENVMIIDHAFEGFETEFEFAPNPIFSNTKLSINLKFPPPSEESDDEEEEDQPEAEATVTPIEWKDASYPKTHPNSWFVKFFIENFIDDYDNQQVLQFLRDHVWPSPLEALSGALNNDEDDDELDPIMMENSDDDGEAPDLIAADDDDDEE